MITATSIFICCLSLLTKAKTVDLAVAGATYVYPYFACYCYTWIRY
jgi:hypothetical protein